MGLLRLLRRRLPPLLLQTERVDELLLVEGVHVRSPLLVAQHGVLAPRGFHLRAPLEKQPVCLRVHRTKELTHCRLEHRHA